MNIITFLKAGKQCTCVCDQESLFETVCMLEDSEKITAYKVSYNHVTVKPEHYGWGDFHKWTESF